MKKYGFTLIELPAVIVVLAIIALIATPIVMNVISNAQKGAAERSADNYIKAVETLIATKGLDGEIVEDNTYTIGTDGNLSFGDVELSGTKPNGGSIEIKDGQVVKGNTSINVGDYTVTFEDGVASVKELAKLLDVCGLQSATPNVVGAKYTCDLGDGDRTFYVLEAGTSSKPATLILEGNYDTTTPSWCASGNNSSCNANGLDAKLNEIALAWSKLYRNQIGIPSVAQLLAAAGRSTDEIGDEYTNMISLGALWLTSWPNNTAWGNSIFGYWTSTPYNNYAFVITYAKYIEIVPVDTVDAFGIRPVIMLSI